MRDKLKALLRLQHFADGTGADGSGVNGTDAGYQEGVTADVAGQQAGVEVQNAPAQESQQEEKLDREAAFDKFIKENKDLYDARVSNIVRQRLAKPQKAAEQFKKLAPALDTLGQKYNVDPTDVDAIVNAVQNDEAYLEDEALQRGISVNELKLERSNRAKDYQIKQLQEMREADRIRAQWEQDAQKVKQIYPSFDLYAELQSDQFQRLLTYGVDMRDAYELCHRDEIIPNAMQYAAQTAEKKVANAVKANSARPTENGMASQAAATGRVDVSRLTDSQFDELTALVKRGESIQSALSHIHR